jgi:CRISPR/Cas system CSM-associated protein Csm3 (group 7 of RAMP superfamily)
VRGVLKRAVTQARLEIELTPLGGLSIAGAETTVGGHRNEAPIQVVIGEGGAEQPIIPGSSLKGALRAEAERLWRARGEKVCAPPEAAGNCAVGRRGPKEPEVAYTEVCPACRLFGSVHYASRVTFADAVATRPGPHWQHTVVRRPFAPIDRVLGSVSDKGHHNRQSVGYWERSMAAEGPRPGAASAPERRPVSFGTTICGDNLTVDQLAMLAQVVLALCDGWIPMGGARSRGMGELRGTPRVVDLVYAAYRVEAGRLVPWPGVTAPEMAGERLYGAGGVYSAIDPADARRYGYTADDWCPVPSEVAWPEPRAFGAWAGYRVTASDARRLLEHLAAWAPADG